MQQNLPPLVLTLSKHMPHHRVAVWNFRDAFFLHLKKIEFSSVQFIQSNSAGIIASSTHSSWGKLLVDTLENERHMESSLLMSPLVKHWCFHILVWETTKQIICSIILISMETVAFFCPAEGCQTARSTHALPQTRTNIQMTSLELVHAAGSSQTHTYAPCSTD